jgi:hypothetical protein
MISKAISSSRKLIGFLTILLDKTLGQRVGQLKNNLGGI